MNGADLNNTYFKNVFFSKHCVKNVYNRMTHETDAFNTEAD